MERYIIGIDSGTTGIKAVLFDVNGKEIAKKTIALKGYFPEENQYEEDMKEIWEKAQECVRSVAKEVVRDSVIGIGITAQGDGLWMVDENMEPVRRGCCFCDGRAAEFVDQWVEDGTCEKLFELTGTWIFTGNQNGIVRWMEKYEKESLDRSRWLMHLKDYLFYQFTGQITTDATDQSLIFLDQNKRDYLDEAYEVCGLKEYKDKYPPVKTAKDNAYLLLPELAESLGLSDRVLVTSGPMDVSACALGSGVIENAHCCSIIGTAALHEMVIDKPLQDKIKSGMTVSHVMENRWLRLMASLAGTPNLEWMLSTVGYQIREDADRGGRNVYEYMEELIKGVPIGSHGVMYHPYLLAGGERAPFTDSRARAGYTGLSVKTSMADIVRATYEGVAFAMLDCYEHMPLSPEQITICGGGAGSSTWCQMFADALGSRIITVEGEELGARGAAVNNMVIQSIYSDYRDAVLKIVKVKRTYEPDMHNHRKYMKFYELYKEIYTSIRGSWKMRENILKE